MEVKKHEDGIICPSIFKKEKIKLLFITKEPNKGNHENNYLNDEPFSFINEWCNEKPDYPFAHRIAELSYGVLEKFKPYDNISSKNNELKRFKTLKRIAFINVKKTAGGPSINDSVLIKTIEEDGEILRNHIQEINPSHIIIGITNISILEKLFTGIKFHPTRWGCSHGDWNNIKILQFYHPSARVGNAALYSFLKINFESI